VFLLEPEHRTLVDESGMIRTQMRRKDIKILSQLHGMFVPYHTVKVTHRIKGSVRLRAAWLLLSLTANPIYI
jgi:hypothetical protein